MKRVDCSENYEGMRNRIVASTCAYLVHFNITTMVIGLSGGVDSTLTAALAREAADKGNFTLMGYSLPSDSNKKSEVKNAQRAGEAFCHGFMEKGITEQALRLFAWMEPLHEWPVTEEEKSRSKVLYGNTMARLRMIYLYNIARNMNGLVLSTDNLTELMLGFWTLHGDVGDLGLIQSLWKTEVYGLAGYLFTEYLAAEEYEKSEALFQSIKATPTDGLGITKSDLDQIGEESYEKVDKRLIEFLKNRVAVEGCPVIERHKRSEFKRNNPHNFAREEIVPED